MSKQKKTENTWNSITGVMKLYGNEFEFKKDGKKKKFVKYSVSIGRKVDDGYENYYLTVKFSKDIEDLPGAGLHTIEISNAFLTFESYTDSDGNEIQKPVLLVTDASIIDEEEEEEDTKKSKKKK